MMLGAKEKCSSIGPGRSAHTILMLGDIGSAMARLGDQRGLLPSMAETGTRGQGGDSSALCSMHAGVPKWLHRHTRGLGGRWG